MTRPSPWGSLAVADAHLHFFSHHFFSILVSQKPGLTLEAAGAQLGWQLPPHEPEKLAAAWVHELDRHGVFASALIASIPGDEGSVIAAAHAFPDRFFAYAMVNPRALTAGLPATFSDVRVACLFPAMHGYSIQDDCARPVFEWAQTHRRAMFVHCGVLSVGVRKKLGLPSPFDMRFSNPVDLHAVALRYPEVPIIVPHFGAGYFREALMLADSAPTSIWIPPAPINGCVTRPGTSLCARFSGIRSKWPGPSGCCSERIPRFSREAGSMRSSRIRPGRFMRSGPARRMLGRYSVKIS
jgi:predicted TIM-barrel fold metal-dependent hydrolase